MRITWNELTVGLAQHDAKDLLSEWRWLLGDSMELLLVSSLGDMFLADGDGRVHWLDAGAGMLEPVAESPAQFKELMQQRENANQWFVPQLVGDLLTGGKQLASGECFSYKVPPILGGKLEAANLEPADLSVHFSILGQIHQQVKDLPPGTRLSDVKIEGL